MLDFAANVWPARQPRWLRRELRRALESRRYPCQDEARAAVAARHDCGPAQVLAVNGACEAYWLVAHALRPALVACIEPTFTEARHAFSTAGSQVVSIERQPPGWGFDPAEVPETADVVVVGNPNNPSGTLDRREAILELARPGRLVLVDECFMDFVVAEEHSLAGSLHPGLATLRSLTKIWGLAGVRAGYLLGPDELVARLAAHRQPWSVNAAALAALAACSARPTAHHRIAIEVAAARSSLTAGLQALGLKVAPAVANFLLVEVGDGPRLVNRLRRLGIAIRLVDDFRGLDRRFVRIAVRPPRDNARLLRALRQVL